MARLAGLGALALSVALAGCGARPGSAEDAASSSMAELLGSSAEAGFARALEPRPFLFPADHGPHPGFRTEWWYHTGNLRATDGRRFGYELTFFRNAMSPAAVARASSWGTNEVYMAHFALTDVAGNRFHAFERFGRGAAGLAGSTAEPYRVWLEDWSVARGGNDSVPPIRLVAADGDVAIELLLARGKPLVRHGQDGLSQKGGGPGDASYYYSYTRLPTSGHVMVDGRRIAVTGQSWMDHEWSTSALTRDQVGWDWFSLQLTDGRELMLFTLRNREGRVDRGSGTIVAADGTTETLTEDDFTIAVLERWASPRDGARYPSRWRVEVPRAALALELTPLLANQELLLTVRYWEGAIDATGTAVGEPIQGQGYVELTGY